jgi:8-oxo-dGTP diphosphatase
MTAPSFGSAPASAARTAWAWDETRASSDGPNTTVKKRKAEPNRMAIHQTVCYILDGERLLLIRRAAGLFGAGKWSGLGGKIEAGESKEQACVREVYEESGLHVDDLKYHGALEFKIENTPESIMMHVFSTASCKGQLTESSEGILRWIDFDQIPYREMWDDSRFWLPLLIEGKDFSGVFHFDQQVSKVLDYKLDVLVTH